MKIVTYNVNGLRQRVAQHGSLLRLLNSLDADIICFQETKLSRQDLSVDLTMAEGYEAFFSCTRTSSKGRSGYSGVATFGRVNSAFSTDEVALPLAAEEGFSGLLRQSQESQTREIISRELIKVQGFDDISSQELLKVDGEGRCVVTDHGHFVLFNLYGPRAEDEDEERLRFKDVFFKILQKRWECLLSQGKRVFVVGDLNIAPAAIDRCDAEPGFEKNRFREWLRSLLRESGGHFFDVFRAKHPERKEAYTCFSSRIGAEEYNYGSRIDHILIAGPCLHQDDGLDGHNFLDCHVKECDVMAQFKRGSSEKAPKWKGGRSSKLEGSDHIPVYAIIDGMPILPLHSSPSLAVRYIPEVRGWQQSIVSFLMKGQVSGCANLHNTSSFSSAETLAAENEGQCVNISLGHGTIAKHVMESGHSHLSSDQNLDNSGLCSDQGANECSIKMEKGTEETAVIVESEKATPLPHCNASVKKKARRDTYSQLTLRSFFQQAKTLAPVDIASGIADTSLTEDRGEFSHVTEEISNQNPIECAQDIGCEPDSSIDANVEDPCDTNFSFPSTREKDNFAFLEWQRIHQKMKMSLPLCKGHGEPCVARSVKKGGPNFGRRFYVCARAKGPASNPEANCNYFEWASLKSKRKQS